MRTSIFVLCSAAWMALIFYLSSIPGDELGPDILVLNVIKKTGHFIIFGVLAALYLSALKGRKPLAELGPAPFLLSLLLAFLYAASDEYHQLFTPGRHSSGYDVFIDSCGALTVLGLSYSWKLIDKPAAAWLNKMFKRRSRKAAKRPESV